MVFQTNNPEKALDIAKETIPNLIITDWNMPQLSGIELILKFKQHPLLKEIPIIMVTGAMTSSDDLQIALNAGAIDYIRKPIEPIELIARTSSALMLAKYYEEVIDQKNKELTENTLYLVKGQEFNRSLSKGIEHINTKILNEPHRAICELNELKKELAQKVNEDGWYKFNISFSKVHANFEKNLINIHPKLTPSEIKLCSLIRLGIANKEIASVLNQTTDSVKVSRYRIRKKIDMGDCPNLESYLLQF
jgi:DNA-binding NarL/FixJ family response regulator